MTRPSTAPATSHDVARLAGVSQPTVSRALRDDPRVAEATRRRVREAAIALDYVPSRRGRSLSTRATGQVAVVVGELVNPFYAEAVEHLHLALAARGLRAVVHRDAADGAIRAEDLLDGSVDGAILTTTLLDSDLPASLVDRGLAVTLMNRVTASQVADACVTDNAGGALEMVMFLRSLGHTRIGAIHGPQSTSTGAQRAAGAGEIAPVRRGWFTPEVGHREFLSLMGEPVPPTAVVCANDVVALGALNAARSAGIDVPGDVTVTGFDDIAMAAWDAFDLTTVRQDLPAMARTAAGLLASRLADPARAARTVELPARLVLRGTHAPPRR